MKRRDNRVELLLAFMRVLRWYSVPPEAQTFLMDGFVESLWRLRSKAKTGREIIRREKERTKDA
jgi:hypothetical protein